MSATRLAVLALSAIGATTSAQEIPGPPPVLVVAREEIKPGKMVPHEKAAAGFVAVAEKAKAANYRIALTPVSGDDNMVVYLEGYPSYAAFETARNAFDTAIRTNAALRAELERLDPEGDQHASQRTAIYRYRADLSYRPLRRDGVAKSRYMTITTTRVKPFRGPDYVDLLKAFNVAREKAGTDAHAAVFQSVSGAPVGTFISFGTAQSLKEWDDFTAKMEENQKAIDAALGGPEAVKQRRMLLSEVVADTTSALYAMSPALSRPAPEFVAHDPAFWGARPK